jgi:adenosine deaminase
VRDVTNRPVLDDIRRAPKVLLHDHLDGGLRAATIAELARASGYDRLPTTDPDNLRTWFAEASDSGSLERYLETFDHTVGVMQTEEALTRVAYECAEDLANDGVVYAEVRYAPEQHTRGTPGDGSRALSLEQVVEAVLKGFADAGRDHGIRVGTLLTAMRHQARSMEIAELAVRYRDAGVVGFDIAGAEAGYPPPGRLRVPPARERPLHHPRRRGVRAPVDLAGHPVVRRRPARPRGPHHRRHHGPRRRGAPARPARRVRT